MSWLTPLGFLGFIGLIVLIIIYIIKPNYQNKIISSTFIWKLSLKLRKKKIPVNTLRNILLFLCQVLIISMAAMILARPVIAEERKPDMTEKIIILDASASMLSSTQSVTRFERAVQQARELANQTIDDGGKVSIILASEKATFVVQEATAEHRMNINTDLDSLANVRIENPCTYGAGDMEGALLLAEKITSEREGVEVVLYTDTNYIDSGRVKVENVSDPMEWNAAILEVRAIRFENYYRFEVDVACYGNMDQDIMLYLDIKGVNGESGNISIQTKARCLAGEVVTLVYASAAKYQDEKLDEDIEVFSYQSVSARVEANDSFSHDNTYFLYGGTKQTLKIQYCSPLINNFFTTALMVARDQFGDAWDIDVSEVDALEKAANKGFDIYIYEHEVPKTLPTDGIVIISDPDYIPSSTGLKIAAPQNCAETTLTALDPHMLTTGVTASNITLTMFTPVIQYEGYTPLMGVGSMPVILAKNEPHQKIVLLSFSLHYSNLPVLLDFPLLISNILDYYTPPAITEYVFDVNSTLSLNARSEDIVLVGPSTNVTLTEFPATVTVKEPGVYTASQRLVSDEQLVDTFFVKIPKSESNTSATVDVLDNPVFIEKKEIEDFDLVIYFAILMAALLFTEWWLHSREQF